MSLQTVNLNSEDPHALRLANDLLQQAIMAIMIAGGGDDESPYMVFELLDAELTEVSNYEFAMEIDLERKAMRLYLRSRQGFETGK